jgi:hypothetical protein
LAPVEFVDVLSIVFAKGVGERKSYAFSFWNRLAEEMDFTFFSFIFSRFSCVLESIYFSPGEDELTVYLKITFDESEEGLEELSAVEGEVQLLGGHDDGCSK